MPVDAEECLCLFLFHFIYRPVSIWILVENCDFTLQDAAGALFYKPGHSRTSLILIEEVNLQSS